RGGDVDSYLAEHVAGADSPGPLVDGIGQIVGEHRGASRYTIGQRKGLGVSLGEPVFVTRVDTAHNTVTIGSRGELACDGLGAAEARFVGEVPRSGEPVLVQHRAHGEVVPASFEGSCASFEITFGDPVEAIAPGQSVVLYSPRRPEELLGGGIIAATRAAHVAA
ncbi:MAG TPA: tRNA methyl transferase PRC-barrel domain-containing protein, partial [Actinomycetota bacterium]|nr:tRNA methyl transferase PRC-barrel domain-containing protein [Actinomycetota bacterium]